MPPARLLLLVASTAFALLAVPLHAQPTSGPPGTDLTPEQRRAYNAGLSEARALMAQHEWAKATARLDALIKERPREAQARFLRAVAQAEQGDADGAITTYRALIDDYPELPEPYNNLAVLYARRGDIEAARAALETAIKTAPDWAVAHENLGDVYARLALEQYDRAATLDRANKTAPAKLKSIRDLLGAAAPKP